MQFKENPKNLEYYWRSILTKNRAHTINASENKRLGVINENETSNTT